MKVLFSPIYSAEEYSKIKQTASKTPVFDLGASFSVLFPDLEIAASGETLIEDMDMPRTRSCFKKPRKSVTDKFP